MKKRPKSTFGEFLVEQIKIAGMSQEEFYNAVGIKKPYFYDLLTASPPPIELQDRMLAVFDEKTGENTERRHKLYDIAATGRDEIPADIAKLIAAHSEKLAIIRETLTTLLAAQE